MNKQLRLELTCCAADHSFWLHWLLDHYTGYIDSQPIQRYGLAETQLTRQEQVQGYAQYYRLSFIIDAHQWSLWQQRIQQQNPSVELAYWHIGEYK